jgi:hypothetical protein
MPGHSAGLSRELARDARRPIGPAPELTGRTDTAVNDWIQLIEALAKLLGPYAWPAALVVIVVFLSRRHKRAVDNFLDEVADVGLKLPGGELNLKRERIKREQELVESVQKVIDAPPDQREEAVQHLAEIKRRYVEFLELSRLLAARSAPRAVRQAALDALRARSLGMHVLRDGEWQPVATVEEYDKVVPQPEKPAGPA